MLELMTNPKTLQLVQMTSNLIFLIAMARIIPYAIREGLSKARFEFVVGEQAHES